MSIWPCPRGCGQLVHISTLERGGCSCTPEEELAYRTRQAEWLRELEATLARRAEREPLTEAEHIAGGVALICDTSLGGP